MSVPSAGRVIGTICAVMVTHDGAQYVAFQLKSMLSQTVRPDRIIVVDDCSTDGTPEICERVFQENGWTEYEILQAPSANMHDLYTRIAANFQVGLRRARGFDYILLGDQDDLWLPDRVDRQVRILAGENALLVASDAQLIGADGERLSGSLFSRLPSSFPALRGHPELREVLFAPSATGACCAMSSKLLDAALPIPAGWLHDRWISLVAAARDGYVLDSAPVIRYRVHADQVVGLGANRQALSTQMRKFFQLTRRLRARATSQENRRQLSAAALAGTLAVKLIRHLPAKVKGGKVL
jgi:glycosyltransferase involved in cell wall biosynthesis